MTENSAEVPGAGALHSAARAGDRAAITRMIAAGADVEAPDALGRTPLLVAAREGQTEAARVLLEVGANPDTPGETLRVTPLMAAAQRGDSELVRLLLESGADPNAVARNGATALARVALSGDVLTARALLEAGANPDGAGSSAPPNTAPLWAAIALKRVELVRLLLEHGAQANIGDSTTDTAFGVAVSGGDAVIARLLLDGGVDPARPALQNLPLLAVAMRFSNPPMAALLEEYGLSLATSDTEKSYSTSDRMGIPRLDATPPG